MTPLELLRTRQAALCHAQQTELSLIAEASSYSTVACTGAYILARTAWYVQQAQTAARQAGLPTYRTLARQILEEALDDVELMMTETEGSA